MAFDAPSMGRADAARLFPQPLRMWPDNARRLALAKALNRLEDLRQEMIAELDTIEGDPDFEVDAGDDREEDHDRELDRADDEPWLGRQETGWGATQRCGGADDDRELDRQAVEAFL